MANNNQNNAAGMPLAWRLGFVLVLAYGAAWAWDNFVQPQHKTQPATVGAQTALRGAVGDTHAKVWK